MTTFDNSYNSQSGSDQQTNHPLHQPQNENVAPPRRGDRVSFGQDSLTSDGVGGRRSFSSTIPFLVSGEGQTGTNWERRDLSRRPNIHRSHLSSSIQTGMS
jgi:hypothetical protein